MINAAEALSTNYAAVQREIHAAAERAGRDPAGIRLVAVTKTVPPERVREAFRVGLRAFGENRVQEAVAKIDALQDLDCEWHMVGHLQTNKVRFVEGRFSTLHSLDSERLIETHVAVVHRQVALGIGKALDEAIGDVGAYLVAAAADPRPDQDG